MSCAGCGAQNLESSFGSCARCTIIAAFSSAFFWIFYFLSKSMTTSKFLTIPLLGFACMVTILLVAHLLGHAERFRRGSSPER